MTQQTDDDDDCWRYSPHILRYLSLLAFAVVADVANEDRVLSDGHLHLGALNVRIGSTNNNLTWKREIRSSGSSGLPSGKEARRTFCELDLARKRDCRAAVVAGRPALVVVGVRNHTLCVDGQRS